MLSSLLHGFTSGIMRVCLLDAFVLMSLPDSFYFIIFISAVCEQGCRNGGHCVAPNKCSCQHGYTGDMCEKGK